MDLYCTRPSCPRPKNSFPELDDRSTLRAAEQRHCQACGMPLFLAGRYLSQRPLGKGGFGQTFLAIDRFTPARRTCVVKLFQPNGNLSPSAWDVAQKLFEREAEVLEQVGNAHDQIPDLLAFFSLKVPSPQVGQPEDELFYLVQEFIDGVTLEEEVSQVGPLSLGKGVAVLREILAVLAFVHGEGVIHRDIKPSNIMRDRQGTLFLLDFGAVKQVTQSANTGMRRSTGIYSAGYAPPEQVSRGQVYPSTDLYALAVTCLVLMSGQDPEELVDAYTNQWIYRQFIPKMPAGLVTIFDRMLQAAPSDRYQSAQATLDALEEFGRSLPSTSPSSTASTTSIGLPSPSQAGSVPASPAPSSPPTMAQIPPPSPVSAVSQSPSPASPLAPPAPTPPFPVPPAPAAPVAQRPPTRPPLPLVQLISHAAFTGSQASLLGIAIASTLGTSLLGTGTWLGLMAGLIALQITRTLEGKDLPIIAGLVTIVVVIVPPLRKSLLLLGLASNHIPLVIMLGLTSGLIAVVGMLIFQLIYRLLQRLL